MASTISGFIALVAMGALNAVSHSAQAVNRVTEVNAEVRFAARMIAQDLANLYRDPNPEDVKLVGASQGSETTGPPFLTFYAVGRAKARADQPEGDVYEVEYILGAVPGQEDVVSGSGQEGASTPPIASGDPEPMVLFRRLWPNPDKDRPPGGILTPIAENIAVFYIRFHDGQEWAGQWTEEMRALPRLVEVTLGTAPPEKGAPVLETFTISFPRMAEASAGASQQGESSEGQQSRPQESSSESSGGQDNSGGGGGNANQDQGNQGNQGNQGRGGR